MQDLSSLEPFISYRDSFSSLIESLKSANSLVIETSADLESILALVHLEAALLDAEIPYRRHLTNPIREGKVESSADLIIRPFEEASDSLNSSESSVSLTPLMSSVTHGASTKERPVVVDVVALTACLALMLAPQGERVRRLRPLMITGSWLRSSLDSGLDSMYTYLKDNLRDEGSIRVVPLTEVSEPDYSAIPDISERMIKRLTKVWPEMDFEQRSMALSEMMLPTLRSSLSAARIEELGWQRLLSAGSSTDIASQISIVEREWKDTKLSDILFASTLADRLIMTGNLV